MKFRTILPILLSILVAGCNLNGSGAVQPPSSDTQQPDVAPTASQPLPPAVPANRIAIRSVGGDAEFYDIASGDKFIPRGGNYVDFAEVTPGQVWEDYIFGAGTYQPGKVRQAFQRMSVAGYNTVRLFFDHCYSGPACIGNPNGDGLNPVFLDHMVEVMRMAAEEDLYLILTANGVPLDGNYWNRFSIQYDQDGHAGFGEFYENGYYLHAAGVAMQAQYWRDLMSGLAERGAPFEVVLGWQLQNEYWLFKTKPPLSLQEGQVVISNGRSYDMSVPDQKRQMVTDGTLFWMETLIPIIKEYDPAALVTVGFFAPDLPNQNDLATDWYRDTASLIEVAPVDFWDFHAYPEPPTVVARNMQATVENFGMTGYQAKPVIMGEFGAFRHVYPDLETATHRLQEWIVESCEYGFDGWLLWEYYNRPADDAVWGLENQTLFDALAPVNVPDACAFEPAPLSNLAYGNLVTASNYLHDSPPGNVVDGGDAIWNAGAGAPQWIEVDLGALATIAEIRLWVAQDPAGETTHRILVRDAGGNLTEVHRFSQVTADGDWLEFTPDAPLEGVLAVRIETTRSPSFVAWREIELYQD